MVSVADFKPGQHAIFVQDPVGWNLAFKSWGGTLGVWLRMKTEEFRAVSIAEAPGPGKPAAGRSRVSSSTGNLQRHIETDYGRSATGQELESRVVANVAYAKYVHEPTRPHMIYPKSSESLAFFWPNAQGVIQTMQVKHPGTDGNPFLMRAARKVFLT